MSLPKVGDRGSYSVGSDTYPVTVVKVSPAGAYIDVRYERYEGDKSHGHDWYGDQVWKISEDPNGSVERFYRSKKDPEIYGRKGWWQRVRLNGWRCKLDPSF